MKYFSLKCIFLLFMLSATAFISGQDLSGDWTGVLPQNTRDYVFTMKMNIKQSGNKISGTSRYADPDNNWVILKFSGTIIRNKITFTETAIVNFISKPNWNWCIKALIGNLTIDKVANKYIIEGNWTSNKLYDGVDYYMGYCPAGQFRISKSIPKIKREPQVISATVSGQVFNKQNNLPVEANMAIVSGKTQKQIVSTSEDGKYIFKSVVGRTHIISISENGYEPYRDTIKTDKPVVKKNLFLTPETKLEIKLTEPKILKTDTPKISATKLFLERKIEVVKAFDVISDSIDLNFYDNGDIDNDTITVYYNKALLLNKKRLTDKPLTIKVPVSAATDNEIIMYADNVGSIPPNTALMIFYDAGKRREIRIDSNTKKSGTVIIRKVDSPN